MAATDKVFDGSIPEIYDRFLVPLIFETYAHDLTGRIIDARPRHILETAAGTGVRGSSSGASGVHGSGTNYGVRGDSTNNYGVFGVDGSELEVLTSEDTDHDVVMTPTGKFFLDTQSRWDLPPVTVLCSGSNPNST